MRSVRASTTASAKRSANISIGGFSGHVTVVEIRLALFSGLHDPSGYRRCRCRRLARHRTRRWPSRPRPSAWRSGLRRYKRRLKSHNSGNGSGELTDIAYTVMAPTCRRRRRSAGGFRPGHRRRIDHRSEDHVGRVGGHRTRHQGQSGLCLPQCRKRPCQHRLPPARRKHRLDRPVHDQRSHKDKSRPHAGGGDWWRHGRTRDFQEWI